MDKFSFFDFVAFLVPGGTFIVLAGWFIHINFPEFLIPQLPDMAILILPFLFVAYITGHTLSTMGRFFEMLLPADKFVYTRFFKKFPDETNTLNGLAKKIFSINILSGEQLNVPAIKQLFEKITDYLEITDIDKKTVILYGQHVFFRNTLSLSLIMCIISLIAYASRFFSFMHSHINTSYYLVAFFLFLVLLFISFFYSKHRKEFMVRYSFRNFIALSYKN